MNPEIEMTARIEEAARSAEPLAPEPKPARKERTRRGQGNREAAPIETAEADAAGIDFQKRFFSDQRLREARIPRRFWKKSFENFQLIGTERKRLLESAKQYVKGFNLEGESPKGLLMIGKVGCGKSHLAASILVKVIEKGYSGLFFNSLELLQKLRATIDGGNGGLSEDDLLEEIASVDLLVFDDLGAEKVSDYVKDRFYLVVNKRYEDCRPIIVTTNLTLQELENRMGERLVSRLLEMCVKFQIFPKEDFRQRCLGEDRGRSKSGSSVD